MDIPHIIRMPQQLGPLMRAFRKQAGMSQAELAHSLGISRQAISALELAPETATFERLMKVWAVLGLRVSLQRDVGDPPPVDLEW